MTTTIPCGGCAAPLTADSAEALLPVMGLVLEPCYTCRRPTRRDCLKGAFGFCDRPDCESPTETP